jgi:ribosome-associated protein
MLIEDATDDRRRSVPEMLHIMTGLFIPENEIGFSASRSGGPGGQNVNKVSSKVTLAFDIAGSSALSDDQKEKIREKLARRINKEGILQVVSQRTRSQDMNRADALERFADLLRRALTPKRVSVKTRPPAGSKERRLESKRKRAITKEARSGKGWE